MPAGQVVIGLDAGEDQIAADLLRDRGDCLHRKRAVQTAVRLINHMDRRIHTFRIGDMQRLFRACRADCHSRDSGAGVQRALM
jgi:hypothetical protein